MTAPGFAFPFELSVPYEQTLDGVLGLQLDAVADDEVRAHLEVGPAVKQVMGLVHGGVYAAVAESLASIPTLIAAQRTGHGAAGLSNHASFLCPVLDGTLHGHARRVSAGDKEWVWDVDFFDDDRRRCAVVRVIVAITAPRAA